MKDSSPSSRRKKTPSSSRYFVPALFSALQVFMRLETTLRLAYDMMMCMMSRFHNSTAGRDSELEVFDMFRDSRSRWRGFEES